MENEVFSEQLVEIEMNIRKGENSFGFVFPQGDIQRIEKIENLLKKAGGKPDICDLHDFSKGGNGKAKPEYIITFNDDTSTILVIECKKSTKQHVSEQLNQPKKYAVDGVLYYAKFLKEEYNVVAIAVSGTKKEECKVSTFFWQKGFENKSDLVKANGIILEPLSYLKLIKGERIQKKYSIEEIRETALIMHNALRGIKMTERSKPIFIAGILIALQDEDFGIEYSNSASFNSVLSKLINAIKNVLEKNEVKGETITNIIQIFNNIGSNPKFKEIPLTNTYSILWYIEQLDLKIKPMMNHADVTLDALGVFYHEFVKYSGGDGKGLGIVLTPQHLTEFMVEVSGVNKNSRVVDVCAGSGAFLVSAMSKMFKDANDDEIYNIRQNSLYGVELDEELYTLCVTNMIVRKDGKSNIIHGDCFSPEIKKRLKEKHLTIGLINPPYSQKDHNELQFVECLLDVLSPQGIAVVVVPMACAIGTKFKTERERLFKKHTLKAVFSMPDDIFYSNNASTNVCVLVWEAHKPHDILQQTFFGYYKDDGFVKAKKLGRIDKFNRWKKIKDEWLNLYRERIVKEGMSAKKTVKWNEEWLCEAYMETDYTKLTQNEFKSSVRKYLAYLILTSQVNLEKTFLQSGIIPDLQNVHWDKFRIVQKDNKDSGIFKLIKKKEKDDGISKIVRGKRLKSEDREAGSLRYFSASELNNGMTDSISNPLFVEKDALIYTTFGDCFYVNGEFTASDEINIFKHSKMNKYSGLFIATVISQNKYRYRFGRKAFFNKFENEIIKLPVDKNGDINWQFMEDYIKSLPYSDRI